jgi:hypothetical protein
LNSLPFQISPADAERFRRYRRYLDFYRGEQWSERRRWSEKQLTFNYARVFVDKITSYLMSGAGLTVEAVFDTPADRALAEQAEKLLAQVYEENNLAQLDYETETDCAVLGDACYKVIWDAPARSVRVSAPDIQNICVWHRGDDPSRILKVAATHRLTAAEAAALYGDRAAGAADTGGMVNITEIWTEREFELYLNSRRLAVKGNPCGCIPFIIFPNLREPKNFWGTSDLATLIEPQQELNRAMSQISRILELSGNPIAVLENVEEAQDIAVRPGAVWTLPEDSRAYLLDLLQGGGLKSHIEYIELLYRALHDLSEAPRASFGGLSRELSGVALQIELYPLLQKIGRKRVIRTAAYRRRGWLIYRLLEKFAGAPHLEESRFRLRVNWGTVLPQDFSRLAADEQTLIGAGVHSRRRAMDALGICDPDAEFKRWLAEQQAILAMHRKEVKEQSTTGRESEEFSHEEEQ